MGVLKNDVGRPSNKTIIIRRILKVVLLIIIIALAFLIGYNLKDKNSNNPIKSSGKKIQSDDSIKTSKEELQLDDSIVKKLYSEIENVAENIISLVKENKYKYGEISIITKNIDTYSSLAKAIFSKYKIPLYIDEKADLGRNILAKYILSIIEIFSRKLVI